MSKKTINVKELKEKVNGFLSQSTCNEDVRRGMICILENVLQDSGNYKGYDYLNQTQVPAGHKPGININIHGEDPFIYDIVERWKDTDNTRVKYI
jgi:hypothetical protein